MKPSDCILAIRFLTVLASMPIAFAMEILDGCGGFSRYHQCFARCNRVLTSMASRPKAACFSRRIEGITVHPAFISVGVHFSSFRLVFQAVPILGLALVCFM